MFGITLAAAELTKNFTVVHYASVWEPQCLQFPIPKPCKTCKRFDTALREWIKLNHPNYRRYT